MLGELSVLWHHIFFFFFLINLWSVYSNSPCQRFLGRPLLLLSASLFVKIRSSLILSSCAYQFSLLHLIQSLIFWIPHFSLIYSLFCLSNSDSLRILLRVVISAVSNICIVLTVSGLVSAAQVSIGLTIVLYRVFHNWMSKLKGVNLCIILRHIVHINIGSFLFYFSYTGW